MRTWFNLQHTITLQAYDTKKVQKNAGNYAQSKEAERHFRWKK